MNRISILSCRKKIPEVSIARRNGFTLVELMVIIVIIGILATLAIPVYQSFVGKAKVTVAESTLVDLRNTLISFSNENGGVYPDTIDFTTGLSDQGKAVLHPPLIEQIAKDLFLPSITYVRLSNAFTLTAQANDDKHTAMVLTENSLKIQGQ